MDVLFGHERLDVAGVVDVGCGGVELGDGEVVDLSVVKRVGGAVGGGGLIDDGCGGRGEGGGVLVEWREAACGQESEREEQSQCRTAQVQR